MDETEDHVRSERTAAAEGQTEETSSVSRAAKSKSQVPVPVWRGGLAW
ncbi:hypothetical protein T261_8618 [Streptomyces lydicus]|nr:hypothetical protein T261_8618 [Streptomyces lydicus]